MTPLKLTHLQETVRFTEVGCSAPEIRLGSAQDALRIIVDSGPKQSFQIKKIDGVDHILADTPLIPAGESYLWKPTTKGTYLITSTIYDGLATTITVGLSSTPPQNSKTSNNNNINTINNINSVRGPVSAVDDRLHVPLASRPSRSSLLGVSTSSTTSISSPLSSASSSFYETPGARSTASSTSTPNGSGDAAFRLPRTSVSSLTRSSSGGNGSFNTSPSSASAVSLALPSRAQRFSEDDEEYDFEELEQHPSLPGLRQRRRSVGTDTSDHLEQQQQQQLGGNALNRNLKTMTASGTTTSSGGASGGVPTRPRRQLIAVSQPFRRSLTPDIAEEGSSPIQPCSPLAGPNTTSRYGNSKNSNSNSMYSTLDEPVKLVDVSRLHSSLVGSNGGVGGVGAVNSSSGSMSMNKDRSDLPSLEIQISACPRCKREFACLSNQQRCIASHIKRGKLARHPPRASSEQIIAFWNGLSKEQRLDIIDYSSIPEASNAFYDLFALLEKLKESFYYYSSSAAGLQLEKAGKQLTKTLIASDKIDELTGEQFLKMLEAATEGTLLFGGGGSGSGIDDAAISSSSSSSSPSPPSILECTVILGSVLGARLLSALKAEQNRKAELACLELEAALVAEEQHYAGEAKKKKAKSNKRKNKKKKKADAAVSNAPSNAGGDEIEKEEEEEEEQEADVTTAARVLIEETDKEKEGLLQEQEKEREDDDGEENERFIPVSLKKHQRPMFDSCVEETEVAVAVITHEKLHNNGETEAVLKADTVLENGAIQIEDSAADDFGGALTSSATEEVVLVFEEDLAENSENDFIVDFSDDNAQQQEEEEEAVKAISAAAAAVEKEPVIAVLNADADAFVVVKKIEKKIAKANKVPVPEQPQQQQYPQQQQQERGGAITLSKSARKRLTKKSNDQAKRAAAAAELVPGEPPRTEVASGVVPVTSDTRNITTNSTIINGISLSNSTAAAANQVPAQLVPAKIEKSVVVAKTAAVPLPPVHKEPREQQQQGKQGNKNKRQQQHHDRAITEESKSKSETPLPKPRTLAIKEEKEKKLANNASPGNTLATETPLEDAASHASAHHAMHAVPGYYGGPSYHQMATYYPPPPPHIEAYNPHMYMHTYPMPQQPASDTITPLPDASALSNGAVGGLPQAPPPPPPPGISSSSAPAPTAVPYSRYPYMLPPPPPPPGMMHLPLHPMALPVLGTPAAGMGDGITAAPTPPQPLNHGSYPLSSDGSSSPLADGVVLGIPVDCDQHLGPQLTQQSNQVEEEKEEIVEQAAVKQEIGSKNDENDDVHKKEEHQKEKEHKKEEEEGEDRFKKMLWDAQLRSVNGDVSLLRQLTAQLNEATVTSSNSLSSSRSRAQVSTGRGDDNGGPAVRATFDMEAAKRYFEKKSKELIEEEEEDTGLNTSAVVAVEEKLGVTAAAKVATAAPPLPPPAAAAPSKTVPPSSSAPVAMPPPKNPYLHALSRNATSNNAPSQSPNSAVFERSNSVDIDGQNGQQNQKVKKKVRGPRHKHLLIAGIGGGGSVSDSRTGVEATGVVVAPKNAVNTFSEAHRPAPLPQPQAPGGGGAAAGTRRFPSSRQNSNGNHNIINTHYDNRRRNNNNNNGHFNNNNNNGSTAAVPVHANQRRQEPSSFLAAARGAALDAPKLGVSMKSSSNNGNNNNNNNNANSGPRPQGASGGSGEWKIQARA